MLNLPNLKPAGAISIKMGLSTSLQIKNAINYFLLRFFLNNKPLLKRISSLTKQCMF